MKKQLYVYSMIVSHFLGAVSFLPFQSETEVESELNFLTSLMIHGEITTNVGASYQGTISELSELTLPLGYYDTADYWGKYVCHIPGYDCHVTDLFNSQDYTLMPVFEESPDHNSGGDLQAERVCIRNGIDIYDGACWQIALAIAAKNNKTIPSGENLFKIAQNEDILLREGYNGNAKTAEVGANRAITHPINSTDITCDNTKQDFCYNGLSIRNPKNHAYFFRYITRNWLSTDPFLGTPYLNQYVTANKCQPGCGIDENPRCELGCYPNNSDYIKGKISWLDWKPITGENAWGLLLGPLQTAYLQQQSLGHQFVPFHSDALQNALNVLGAFASLQSEIGGVYYVAARSLGNVGNIPVNPHEVSVENNLSVLAGVMILNQILQDELKYNQELTGPQRKQVRDAINTIHIIVHGGQTPQIKHTKGLLSFLKNHAWWEAERIFYQGGWANDPTQSDMTWEPNKSQKAVDTITWGVGVLGQPLIDSWHGMGTCYEMWNNVKDWGGFYGPNNTLWGVGFSNQDGNGTEGDFTSGIISSEWTMGAINMLRCLITQYQEAARSPDYSISQQRQALIYVENLQEDHDSMCQHVLSLRSDQYPISSAYESVRPADYTQLIYGKDASTPPLDKLSFVYASKRYFIPFGWFSNPLPSTTGTSWSIILHYNFNPFNANGSYNTPSFDININSTLCPCSE